MFIYPITIILILLNVLPEKLASPAVFKTVVGTTFLFSIPDFLKFIVNPEILTGIQRYIPLSEFSLGWVLPAVFVFIFANLLGKRKTANE